MKDEEAVRALIKECDRNISEGTCNDCSSYDEGVRDALLWLFDGNPRPDVGQEG